jgi:hypothetical protein
MAAREVIYFPFRAQLSRRQRFLALLPPRPVAESPLGNSDRNEASNREKKLPCITTPSSQGACSTFAGALRSRVPAREK